MNASRLIGWTAVAAAAVAVAVAGTLPAAATAAPRIPSKHAGKLPKVAPSKKTVYAPVLTSKKVSRKKVTRNGARLAAYGSDSFITGTCNGNSLVQLGSWDATAMINSTYAGGDTYYFKFHLYDRARGAYVAKTDWSAGHRVAQAPSRTWITNFGAPVFNIVRDRWYAVYLETWSYKLGGVMARGFVEMQHVGASMSQTDGPWYCAAF